MSIIPSAPPLETNSDYETSIIPSAPPIETNSNNEIYLEKCIEIEREYNKARHMLKKANKQIIQRPKNYMKKKDIKRLYDIGEITEDVKNEMLKTFEENKRKERIDLEKNFNRQIIMLEERKINEIYSVVSNQKYKSKKHEYEKKKKFDSRQQELKLMYQQNERIEKSSRPNPQLNPPPKIINKNSIKHTNKNIFYHLGKNLRKKLINLIK